MYLLDIKNTLYVTQETLEEARATLQTPSAPPSPLAMAYSLAEIGQVANAFHEKMLRRMSHLDNKIHQAMGPRAKEYENVLEQNRRLLGELEGLREKVGLIKYQKHSTPLTHLMQLERSISDHVSLEKMLLPQLMALETKNKFNTEKLKSEVKKVEESEQKAAEMKMQMAKMQEQLIRWQIEVATRQSEASMNDVRLFVQ